MREGYRQNYMHVNRQTFIACNSQFYNMAGMSLAERLTARMKKMGLSQSELARRVGVKQPTISSLASGDSHTSGKLHAIARELEATVDWLEGLTDDPSAGVIALPPMAEIAKQLGLALVPSVEIGYSMGGGSIIEDYQQIGFQAFDAGFLARITKGPVEKLFVAQGDGDSMQPTMMHEDNVLIDTSQKTITQQDRIWALAYGDLGMIKRVRRLPGDRYLILSDNPTVVPFEVSGEELHVIGRVVWIGRRI